MKMETVFCRPESMTDKVYGYCPGCSHGIAQRLITEVIDEMGFRENLIGVVGSGCYGNARENFNFDVIQTLHGRGPAVATGLKRTHPDLMIFTLQGDGDLASIGTAEAIHAANRGERFTTIFLNNANYGMTGGQVAPTTLLGQITPTTPKGRSADHMGYPIPILEMISLTRGVAYATRCALNSPQNINRAKRSIRRAFETQQAGLGYSIVELLSMCPAGWRLKPIEALKWMDEKQMKEYPLVELKVTPLEKEKAA